MKKASAKRKSGTRRGVKRAAKDLAARRPSVKGGAQNMFTTLSNIVKASSDTTTTTTTSLRG